AKAQAVLSHEDAPIGTPQEVADEGLLTFFVVFPSVPFSPLPHSLLGSSFADHIATDARYRTTAPHLSPFQAAPDARPCRLLNTPTAKRSKAPPRPAGLTAAAAAEPGGTARRLPGRRCSQGLQPRAGLWGRQRSGSPAAAPGLSREVG